MILLCRTWAQLHKKNPENRSWEGSLRKGSNPLLLPDFGSNQWD